MFRSTSLLLVAVLVSVLTTAESKSTHHKHSTLKPQVNTWSCFNTNGTLAASYQSIGDESTEFQRENMTCEVKTSIPPQNEMAPVSFDMSSPNELTYVGSYNGNSYFYNANITTDFPRAWEYCNGLGMSLASFKSQYEKAFIESNLKADAEQYNGKHFWVNAIWFGGMGWTTEVDIWNGGLVMNALIYLYWDYSPETHFHIPMEHRYCGRIYSWKNYDNLYNTQWAASGCLDWWASPLCVKKWVAV